MLWDVAGVVKQSEDRQARMGDRRSIKRIGTSLHSVHNRPDWTTSGQRFTIAHELGHAILHRQTVLHRDKPIDGSTNAEFAEPLLRVSEFLTKTQ